MGDNSHQSKAWSSHMKECKDAELQHCGRQAKRSKQATDIMHTMIGEVTAQIG